MHAHQRGSTSAPPAVSRSDVVPQRGAHLRDALHRQHGNRRVQNMIQAKLRIGPVDDPYEREADHLARLAMAPLVGTEESVQRAPVPLQPVPVAHSGFVADRDDPERLGQLRVRVPSLLADAVTGWAWPSVPYLGLFLLPAEGDLVWVEFAEGDLQHPIWSGCGWGKPGGTSEVPPEALDAYGDTAVLRTPGGNLVVLSDAEGGEKITVRSPGGCEVVLDAAAKRVTVQADEVAISGPGGKVQALATEAFVTNIFEAHLHPVKAAPGMTDGPLPPAVPSPDALTTVLKAE